MKHLMGNASAGKACQGTNTLAYSAPASSANTKRFVPLPPDWPESEAEGVQQVQSRTLQQE